MTKVTIECKVPSQPQISNSGFGWRGKLITVVTLPVIYLVIAKIVKNYWVQSIDRKSEIQKVRVCLALADSDVAIFNGTLSMDVTVQELMSKVKDSHGREVSIYRSAAAVHPLSPSAKLRDLLAEDASSLKLVCLIRPRVSLNLKSDEKAGDHDLEETIIYDPAGNEELKVIYFPSSVANFLKNKGCVFPRIALEDSTGNMPEGKFPKIEIENGSAFLSVGTYVFESEDQNIDKNRYIMDGCWHTLKFPIQIDEEEFEFSLEYKITKEHDATDDGSDYDEIVDIRTKEHKILTATSRQVYGLYFNLQVKDLDGCFGEFITSSNLVRYIPNEWDPNEDVVEYEREVTVGRIQH